ncbi:MAG: DGQHR domain-containing protein [SAR324 cluster bacterium]|nr:DGQHR domain-containing protein [SAR324 cluster bacterium]
MNGTEELSYPALVIQQGGNRELYCFAVDGKELTKFTTISRIKKDSHQQIAGYQRHEILNHIAEIRNYLESESPIIPNAIIVAFDDRLKFRPLENQNETKYQNQLGMVSITLNDDSDEEKPGFIVDGQQRLAALKEARIPHFPMYVIAFVAQNEQEQRKQFMLVNSTKPLPKSLLYELLPETSGKLSSFLESRRLPAYLIKRLNNDQDSPFMGLVQTSTNPTGLVKDNSLLRMLDNSLKDGILYRFRNVITGEENTDAMLNVVKNFWRAVSDVFPESWGLPPQRSRLMHGAGIISLGFLMDAISDRYRRESIPDQKLFYQNLYSLKEICCWTTGHWEFGPGSQRKWNELQNTTKDIQLLANYLAIQYRNLSWGSSSNSLT